MGLDYKLKDGDSFYRNPHGETDVIFIRIGSGNEIHQANGTDVQKLLCGKTVRLTRYGDLGGDASLFENIEWKKWKGLLI